jgi:hypothetical protein
MKIYLVIYLIIYIPCRPPADARPGLLQPATACRGGVTGGLASWRWAGKECNAKAADMTLCGPHSSAFVVAICPAFVRRRIGGWPRCVSRIGSPFVPTRLAALAGTGCSTLVFFPSQTPLRRSSWQVRSVRPQRRGNSPSSSPPPRRYAPFWRRGRPPLVDGCPRPARRSRNNAGYPIDRAGGDPL